MNSAIERLLSLRVSDVMTKQVFQVSANDSMESAGEKMRQQDVSGAPVVDESQRCVGVLSATDFLRYQADCSGRSVEGREVAQAAPGGAIQIQNDAPGRVSRYMSPAVQSISADAPMMQAAREMCAQHVHRLPVLDGNGSVVGLISSLDMVASFVHAVEE